jgi:serine/threonine-protein kinase
MLTGQPPFRGANVLEVIKQVIQGEVPPPGKLQKIAPDLEAICLKCLQKDPAQRYADGEELAEDLRCFLEGRRVKARPSSLWDSLFFWRKK